MHSWTPDRVIALAPDASSASAGQALASAKKWSETGRSKRAIWGLCQGSGKQPYQTRIDLTEPAFKCSCPSRKFPCKHGLALLLLYAKEAASFEERAEPGWVVDWLAARTERAEKKAEKAAAPEKPVDAQAQARRAAQREDRVREGIAVCRGWLEDLVRGGLAAARAQSASAWDRMAARMVDAQATGLARYILQVPRSMASGTGWELRTLDLLGRLHLLLRAGERLAELPPDLAYEVRTALGWTQDKEEVLARSAVADRWVNVGSVIEDDGRLRVRRTWLVGRGAGQRALLLDFTAGSAPFDQSLNSGSELDAELAFYPGRLELRALMRSCADAQPIASALGPAADASIEAGLDRYAHAVAANPWVSHWPMLLDAARVTQAQGAWFIADAHGHGLPIRPAFCAGLGPWRLLAATGGEPATIIVEWDGEWALPVSALCGRRFVDLAQRWAA